MDKNNSNIPMNGKTIARPKSLTPAVLGMTNSHGAKLSLHMASEDKKQLLAKLEEWREARREKLAATILAKMNQGKPKPSIPAAPVKSKLAVDHSTSKIPSRESVFERLYKNNAKIKAEVSSRPSQIPKSNFRKSNAIVEKNKPVKALLPIKENTNGLKVINLSTKEKPVVQMPLQNEEKIESPVEGQVSPKNQPVSNGTFSNLMEPMKPDQSEDDQIKRKTFKSLPMKPDENEKPLRRSISMVFRQKRKTEFAVRRSMSAKNLHEMKSDIQKADRVSIRPSPQPREKSIKNDLKSVSFVTPKNKPLTSTYLRTKLEDWLKVNGHPLEGYRHLRCFGINNYEKSFLGTPKIPLDGLDNSHYETAPNTPVDESDKENVTPPTVIQQVNLSEVENWLKELHRLIVEVKYPYERCEEWLAAIRKKCSSCTQLPIYWECLAALHESKGDLKSAIEDYERAIIKGGKVDVVGDSLAQLFDKMVIEQKKGVSRKLEKGLDPKNIFKSTIIKFALQQKALKKLSSELAPNIRQQLYVATPVRRSTRIQTPYKSIEEVTSLQTLSPEILRNVTFKPNESLLRGD